MFVLYDEITCSHGRFFLFKCLENDVYAEQVLFLWVSIVSYQNLRDVQPNPLPECAPRGQGMTVKEGLEPRSPVHLHTNIGGED